MNRLPVIYVVLLSFIVLSCARRPIAYVNGAPDGSMTGLSAADMGPQRLKTGDVISVRVWSLLGGASEAFQPDENSPGDPRFAANAYQVATNGTLDLPLAGNVQAAGRTIPELEAELREKLTVYVRDPVVNLRLVNFKVTVLGEVRSPGVFEVPDGRLNLMEALGLAGDLTIFAERTNALLIRETPNGHQYLRFNLSDPELMAREGIALHNNDILYLEPSKGRISSENNVYRIAPIVISSLTFVVLLLSLSLN